MAVTTKLLEQIVSKFPQQFSLVFAYGSAVFPQNKELLRQGNMIDFIFSVDDPVKWHQLNLKINSKHYSLAKFGGAEFIRSVQENFGANVYFNTMVEVENKLIKYGVVSTNHLVEDLLDWQTLYVSGRLHKPVKIISNSNNEDLTRALHTNLQSALHASLLSLPETFSEEQLYHKISELSYNGDFRMYFGEDKRKIENIVKNQISYFHHLYCDHLKMMPLVHWNQTQHIFEQDCSSTTTLHHLNFLPKRVQHNLLLRWNRDGRYRDMEDVLQVLACASECSEIVKNAIKDIVWWPSITQSAKGIITAGFLKSVKYSTRKVQKMLKSLKK
ncbi:phosphatidate cytidylyltransferase, mitochondrial-like isoform X1 [Stegodyphus dumicola]|uniref:phosphatidate cytidylyltransferase, mitochondrial-like isoform X1 n=1 Tax=Stegodyphus dumicola TaxID=202533 RepID=UPI0015B30A5E|nr:phosphatidate cytidylyltransferase, mitochondrial-like isoform X1 [Stegodyphus dumicola]